MVGCERIVGEMYFVLGRSRILVPTFEAASGLWRSFVEENNLGVRDCPRWPHVFYKDKRYEISYNGKVWDGETVVYNPYV